MELFLLLSIADTETILLTHVNTSIAGPFGPRKAGPLGLDFLCQLALDERTHCLMYLDTKLSSIPSIPRQNL